MTEQPPPSPAFHTYITQHRIVHDETIYPPGVVFDCCDSRVIEELHRMGAILTCEEMAQQAPQTDVFRDAMEREWRSLRMLWGNSVEVEPAIFDEAAWWREMHAIEEEGRMDADWLGQRAMELARQALGPSYRHCFPPKGEATIYTLTDVRAMRGEVARMLAQEQS